MSSLSVDLVTYSDADFSLSKTQPFANGLSTVGSNPLHMQVRTRPEDEVAWIEATTENGLLIVTDAGATVTVSIPRSSLVNLPSGSYVYSIIMSAFDGAQRLEVFRGTLSHNIGPTRWAAGTP
ncbi:hypothetical protein [Bradyrhizobium japonicum]|uniref:hypothetical protein n=1 Tax=Bradyrhizobium japonicum TaxID=375 RepID=UPI00042A5DC6|nr:hypothetical protein [Bradyrhizobium japonicum]